MKNIEEGKIYKTKMFNEECYCVPVFISEEKPQLDMFIFKTEEETTEDIIVFIENDALIRSVYHLEHQFKKDIDIEEFEKNILDDLGNISKDAFDKLHNHWWTIVRPY